jgi:hypothetical protein
MLPGARTASTCGDRHARRGGVSEQVCDDLANDPYDLLCRTISAITVRYPPPDDFRRRAACFEIAA